MIEVTEITHFRGFDHVRLENLRRVNILVGDNGSGKTGLLEALFLACGSTPEIAVRLRQWRGVDTPNVSGAPQEIYDGLFLDLFFNFTKDRSPSVELIGNRGDSRSLRLYYDIGEPTLLPLESTQASSAQASSAFLTGYTPVSFEWKDASGTISKITPRLQASGLQIPPSPQTRRDASFLAARTPIPTSQNARWFSEFSKWGREGKFIATVQAQFPHIDSMTVEVDMGNPVIFVKLPWIERKVPIYLASDGLNKLVTILLCVAHSEGSIVFVDEIENGFHYSRYELLWKQLLSFSEEYDTQLFLATHSWEFLKAGAPIIEKFHRDFALVQVFQEEGRCNAAAASGRDVAAAIENDIDVRGKRRSGR
jgi:AAA domain, putative AbiEii toxin, Type IV TA system